MDDAAEAARTESGKGRGEFTEDILDHVPDLEATDQKGGYGKANEKGQGRGHGTGPYEHSKGKGKDKGKNPGRGKGK